MTELPASEVYFEGSVHHYNQGYAHDWLTGWEKTSDKIWWDIDVVKAGRFDVEIMYACQQEAVGTKLRIEVGESGGPSMEGTLQRAFPPKPKVRSTRHKKHRSVQKFATQKLGEITLPKGRMQLNLQALNKPESKEICDVRAIRLKLLD